MMERQKERQAGIKTEEDIWGKERRRETYRQTERGRDRWRDRQRGRQA